VGMLINYWEFGKTNIDIHREKPYRLDLLQNIKILPPTGEKCLFYEASWGYQYLVIL
jgi:hypothetical protein